ncbi:DUF2782 domain-containing protein [Neptuniibacter pectenicola]|jgi:hypothetical protein|uniref:DUF2782 domain-containing protein n=1 Tax=Neptuniibacter pectenicola TaxID=1806669 RepID=A0ABU9TW33_9GAMM|nr:DUF2782 domain-containing protein [Neptuniibacter pectenicola]KXJ55626.1 MAG: hypothetical protein AXW15_01880 [Neptuniibacter sp. Phe_28]
MKKLLFAALLLITPLAQAEVPPLVDENDPQITIYNDSDKTYYEYRINGELKEIKVVPKQGKTYYLIPAPGEGDFIRQEESQMLIPKWVLFRW